MENRIEEYKDKLLKMYNYEKKKLYPLLKSMTVEEASIVLSDPDILNKINNINNKDIIGMIYRMSPSNVQELLWASEKSQKILLGITKIDEKNINGYLYFSKDRLRQIQLFIKDTKSPSIIESLTSNYFFQVVMLFSDKIPTSILETINVVSLFKNTIASGVYNLANNAHKRTWINYLNSYVPEVLLPEDFRKVYKEPERQKNYWHDPEEDNTIIPMLRTKEYHMNQQGRQSKIDRETLSHFNMKELIYIYNSTVTNSENQNKEEIESFFKEIVDEHINNGTILTSDFLDLKQINHPFQYFVFQRIIEKSKTDEHLEKELITKLHNILFKNQYNQELTNQFYNYIKNGLFNTDPETLSKLLNNPSDVKSIFHMRFNKISLHMNYLNGIEIETLLKLNVKQINKITKLLEDKTQDELSDIYSKAIRLYLVFGLDRTISILKGEYGKVTKAFLDCTSKLDVSNVSFKTIGKKYEPILNEEFINFLFTGNNIYELLANGSVFETTWFHLFNSFSEIKETCKGHITIKQAEIVLKEKMQNVKYEVEPDLYKIEEYLYEIGLGNKTKHSNTEVYDEVVKIYRKQLNRTTSSIPYVKGTSPNGYSYETMRLDDTIAYVLGYRASCCIRPLDIAHNHLLHAILCENGRILLTYDSTGRIVSFSPLKRNGELLIANSIEVIGNKEDKNIAEAFIAGINSIIEETRKNEQKTNIKVACIGDNSYLKPECEPWPQSLPTPTILEKDDPQYARTDIYHKKLDIIARKPNYELSSLVLGEVPSAYTDPRPCIKSCKIGTDAISIEKIEVGRVVNAINYHNATPEQKEKYRKIEMYYVEYAFYNDDWYILIDKSGNYHSGVIAENKEALKEMQATLSVISELTKKKDVEAYILSFKNKV